MGKVRRCDVPRRAERTLSGGRRGAAAVIAVCATAAVRMYSESQL